MSFDQFSDSPFASQAFGTFEIRQLAPRDLASVAAYYLSLDEAGRIARFHSPLDDSAVLRYVNDLPFDRVTVVGAIDRASTVVLGVAELHPSTGGVVPEISVSVCPGSRAALAAAQLLDRIIECAAMYGATRVEMSFRAEDTVSLTLLRQFGAQIDLLTGCATLAWDAQASLGRAA